MSTPDKSNQQYLQRNRRRTNSYKDLQRQIDHAYNRTHTESRADELLAKGQFEEATTMLNRIRGDQQYRAALKLASLPFYEIDFRRRNRLPIDNLLAEDAECVHSDIIEVIRNGRSAYVSERLQGNEGIETKRGAKLKGIISECIVAALIARNYNDTNRSFMLPSSRSDDRGRSFTHDGRLFGVDGIIVRPTQHMPGPRSIQIKSSQRRTNDLRYAGNIQVINVGQLPAGKRPLYRDDSLAQLLVDDLDATISERGQELVDMAAAKIDYIINPRPTRSYDELTLQSDTVLSAIDQH